MEENALATPLNVGDRSPGESDALGQACLCHPDLVAADGNRGSERFISGVWRHGSRFGLRRGRCQCGKQDVSIINIVKFVLTSFEMWGINGGARSPRESQFGCEPLAKSDFPIGRTRKPCRTTTNVTARTSRVALTIRALPTTRAIRIVLTTLSTRTCRRVRPATPPADRTVRRFPATRPRTDRWADMDGSAQCGSELDWWRRFPALLQAELDAFKAHGATASVVSKANGFLVLEVRWPTEAGALALRVGYCPTHPYGRPSVGTSELSLSRHQCPFSGTLCLLTQGSDQWRPGEKVADLIASQLPRAILAAQAHDQGRSGDAAALEEHAPDPLTTYFDHLCDRDSIALYDAALRAPPGSSGPATFSVRQRPTGGVEFILRTLRPANGPWYAPEFEPWEEPAPVQVVTGRWVRMRPEATSDLASLAGQVELIVARDGAGPKKKPRHARPASAGSELTVILLNEEVEYGRDGAGCLFLHRSAQNQFALVRGRRIASDLLARTPVSAGLRDKRVLLVGVGAIGGFVGLELVRAGLGRLDAIDGDTVEPGNSVRWILGREYWGRPKVYALADYATRNYPFSQVIGHPLKVGGAVNTAERAIEWGGHPLHWLRERVREADLVLDATASLECQLFLEGFCREEGKPYILGHATEGAAGGVVAQFAPDRLGCRVCLDEHWSDKSLPEPNVDPSGVLTPVGCNQPTFTGGAFDLQEVSMEMVRAALGVLVPGLYPRRGPGLAIVDLAEAAGGRLTPRWTNHDLAPHPRCRCGDR